VLKGLLAQNVPGSVPFVVQHQALFGITRLQRVFEGKFGQSQEILAAERRQLLPRDS